MNFENKKIEMFHHIPPSGKRNEFKYEQTDGSMVIAMKHDWDGYTKLSENGSRLLFQFDGYAFLDSLDTTDHMHYWIGVSYWNKDHPDTFFELELEPFYALIAIYNENNLPQFSEELKIIEFAGQLLDHLNQNAG